MSHHEDYTKKPKIMRPTPKAKFLLFIELFGIFASALVVAQVTGPNAGSAGRKSSDSKGTIRALNGFIDHRELSAFEQYVRDNGIDNKTLEYFFYEYLFVVEDNHGNGEQAVLISLFRYLNERGVNTDPHYIMGSPLLNAIAGGYFKLAKLLILNGSDVNAEMERERTPLMYACLAGNLEIAKMLVERGADVNAKGRTTAQSPEGSITPLKAARFSGNKKLVAYLVGKGANQ